MELGENARKYHGGSCLPEDTVLHGKYTVLCVLAADSSGISYLVRDAQKNELYQIRECFPHQMAVRSGLTVIAEDTEKMASLVQLFLQRGALLQEKKLPHVAAVADVFEENDTAYCVSEYHDLTSLADAQIPMTPAYVRSLGIMLCDILASMHTSLFCGRLTMHDVMTDKSGLLYLSIDHFFRTSAGINDVPADLQALCEFLSDCLKTSEGTEEATEFKSRSILRAAFSRRYADAAALKRALICEGGADKLASTSTAARRPMLLAALCVAFLGLGIVAANYVYQSRLSLNSLLRTGAIPSGVIDVWAPLPAGSDEQEAVAVYERLTEGFEEKYPGFGVNITLYAESSYESAIASETDALPTVFMDCSSEAVLSQAEDLTLLHRSLHDTYMTDLQSFGNAIPLGCTFPALYWNAYRGREIDGETVAYEDIPLDICYDTSVSYLAEDLADGRTAIDFGFFMDDGSIPILADSSCLYIVQHTPIAVGTVHMLPVSVNGSYPLEYDTYCSVNSQKDTGSKRIGMLWLQYLLTEEAQDILFSDGGGTLPVHRAAMTDITGRHSQYAFVDEALSCFDAASHT